MEKYNLLESLGSLIAKLLSDGLAPHYNEVLSAIDTYQNQEELKYLIYTLNYLKEDSLLLKLKIQDYELKSIIKFLENPSVNNSQSLSSTCQTYKNELQEAEDGFIYIDASDSYEKEYYRLSKNLIGKLRLKHIDYPEEGLTKIYYEYSIAKEEDGSTFECVREITFDHNGMVTDISPVTRTPLINVNKPIRTENAESIYRGLVGELFEDLLKQQVQNTEVTINDL